MNSSTCTNCGTTLIGRWCHACGQQRIDREQRRLRHLFGQFFQALTDLDSRFWRSLIALLFRPGLLSRDYLDGRRVRWMSPVALFLLGSLVYFLAPGLSDFQLSFVEQVNADIAMQALPHPERLTDAQREAIRRDHPRQVHSDRVQPWIEARVGERQRELQRRDPSARYTVRDYAQAYDSAAGEISKPLMLIHLPLLALVLQGLFFWRRMLFAEHFVVAAHMFAFLLLFIELVVLPSGWLTTQMFGSANVPAPIKLAVLGLLVIHIALTLRRVYRIGIVWAVPAAVTALALLMLISVHVYRPLQFMLVFALT